MIQDFKEKDGYKPDVKLEYVDDSGRMLNQKEAFRQLSHRFHGKGSGKKKTEKRSKKQQEEQVTKIFVNLCNKKKPFWLMYRPLMKYTQRDVTKSE